MSTTSTPIEWTDATWNPVRGCSRVSAGCARCYAEKVAARFAGPGLAYEGLADPRRAGSKWTGKVVLVRDALTQPIRWRSPRRIFVNSMSDLFHEALSDEDIDQVYGVMHACEFLREGVEGHTFQVLTKRADRMRAYLSQDRRRQWAEAAVRYGGGIDPDGIYDQVVFRRGPHPRIWHGVSVEDQPAAERRIDDLIASPSAVRFLSCEPLIAPLDLGRWLIPTEERERRKSAAYWAFTRQARAKPPSVADPAAYAPGIDWVIVGGESGTGARPCALEWIERIVSQCASTKTACFVKQLGAYVVSEERTAPLDVMGGDPASYKPEHYAPNGEIWAWRAGLTDRKGADVDQWPQLLGVRQFPEVRDAR